MADKTKLPLIYVRSDAKSHGRTNQIEGELKPGAKVVVIEDLISTGSSSIKAMQALQEAGADVLGLLAIFDYQLLRSVKNFAQLDLPYYSLSAYDDLVDVALENGYIQESKIEFLKEWRSSID